MKSKKTVVQQQRKRTIAVRTPLTAGRNKKGKQIASAHGGYDASQQVLQWKANINYAAAVKENLQHFQSSSSSDIVSLSGGVTPTPKKKLGFDSFEPLSPDEKI